MGRRFVEPLGSIRLGALSVQGPSNDSQVAHRAFFAERRVQFREDLRLEERELVLPRRARRAHDQESAVEALGLGAAGDLRPDRLRPGG